MIGEDGGHGNYVPVPQNFREGAQGGVIFDPYLR